MTNPIETLLDLASKIEDFPEDVSGTDAVSTIRAATEALEARLAEAERDRDAAQRSLSEHSKALLAAEARLAEAERLLRQCSAVWRNQGPLPAIIAGFLENTADSASAVQE